jgi:hypothetical protein
VDPDPVRIQAFDDQKLKKKNTAENILLSFLIKNCNYYCPSYMKSLQPSKENIEHFKKCILLIFSMVVGIFALLDPEPDC